MIKDRRQIQINATPEDVFSLIETMPNKFPVYKIMETKPIFFLRALFVDGLRSAVQTIKMNKPTEKVVLQIGDAMGPFELTEIEKPFKYLFTLTSFFFNCQTGYILSVNESKTMLNFILVADNPKTMEKIYWLAIKPFHLLLAKKVL